MHWVSSWLMASIDAKCSHRFFFFVCLFMDESYQIKWCKRTISVYLTRECRGEHISDESWCVCVWWWGVHVVKGPRWAPSLCHSGLRRADSCCGVHLPSDCQPDQVSQNSRPVVADALRCLLMCKYFRFDLKLTVMRPFAQQAFWYVIIGNIVLKL